MDQRETVTKCRLDQSGTGWGHGNEYSYLIKCGEFLDYLSYYQLLKRTFPQGD